MNNDWKSNPVYCHGEKSNPLLTEKFFCFWLAKEMGTTKKGDVVVSPVLRMVNCLFVRK
jgi:hypothetical protein